MASAWWYETGDIYQWVGNEIEEVNQSSTVQYIHEIDSGKVRNEKPVEYAVAYEKQFRMVKHSNVTMVEYYEYKQRSALEFSSFQEYHVKTFVVGFQEFYFVLPKNVHAADAVFEVCRLIKCLKQSASYELRYSNSVSVDRP